MPGGPPEGSESAWLAATSTVRVSVHDRRHGWPTAAMTTTSTGGCCAIAASDTALPGAAASGSGPGRRRWVVERGFAYLHGFRRRRIRYERLPEIRTGLVVLACSILCWRRLKSL